MKVLYVGADLSKDSFPCSIWVDGELIDLGQFENNQSGFEELATAVTLNKEKYEYDSVQIILESTGGYELYLLSFIHSQGWAFTLPNPKAVRDWAKGVGYRTKTDKVDGRILAHYGGERRPKTQQPVPKIIEQLDSLLQRQEDTQKILRQELNRQHALSYRPNASANAFKSLDRAIAFLESELQQLEGDIAVLLKDNPELRT